jgi:hypothetical protein
MMCKKGPGPGTSGGKGPAGGGRGAKATRSRTLGPAQRGAARSAAAAATAAKGRVVPRVTLGDGPGGARRAKHARGEIWHRQRSVLISCE